MKEYIHYGDNRFRREGIVSINRREFGSKPSSGLWASPVDAELGWKQFCDFEKCSPKGFQWNKHFKFTLKETARILEIHCEDDILPYIKFNEEDRGSRFWHSVRTSVTDSIKFDVLFKEFDGMELFISENYKELHYGVFYTWDCDSIVIWNPDVVVEI